MNKLSYTQRKYATRMPSMFNEKVALKTTKTFMLMSAPQS